MGPTTKKHQFYVLPTPYIVDPRSSQLPKLHNSLLFTIPLLTPNTPYASFEFFVTIEDVRIYILFKTYTMQCYKDVVIIEFSGFSHEEMVEGTEVYSLSGCGDFFFHMIYEDTILVIFRSQK